MSFARYACLPFLAYVVSNGSQQTTEVQKSPAIPPLSTDSAYRLGVGSMTRLHHLEVGPLALSGGSVVRGGCHPHYFIDEVTK